MASTAGEASPEEFRAADPAVVTVPDPYAFAEDAEYSSASAYDPGPEMSALPFSSVGVSSRTEFGAPSPGGTYPGGTYPGSTSAGGTYPGSTSAGSIYPGSTSAGSTSAGSTSTAAAFTGSISAAASAPSASTAVGSTSTESTSTSSISAASISAGPPPEAPRRPRGGQHAARHGKPSRWRGGGGAKPAASPPAPTQTQSRVAAVPDLDEFEQDRTLERFDFFAGDEDGNGSSGPDDPTSASQQPPWEQLGDGS
jgi:hypothetical protein